MSRLGDRYFWHCLLSYNHTNLGKVFFTCSTVIFVFVHFVSWVIHELSFYLLKTFSMFSLLNTINLLARITLQKIFYLCIYVIQIWIRQINFKYIFLTRKSWNLFWQHFTPIIKYLFSSNSYVCNNSRPGGVW